MENFTTNLNQLARVGGIDPLIGREKSWARDSGPGRRRKITAAGGESGAIKPRSPRLPAWRIVQAMPEAIADCTILARHWLFAGGGPNEHGDFEKRFQRCSNSWAGYQQHPVY